MKHNLARNSALALSAAASLIANASAGGQEIEPKPTRGFYSTRIDSSVLLGQDFTEIQVLRDLPAGRYIANASALLVSNDSEAHLVNCFFTLDGEIRGERAVSTLPAAPDGFVTLPLTIGFILRSPHDLGLACNVESPGTTANSLPSPISVIRVDSLRVEGFRIIED